MADSSESELVISREDLFDGKSHLFRGTDHGGAPISFFWGHYSQGEGPKLHMHPYEEVHIVEEGSAAFTLEKEKIDVEGGHVIITPRNTPHKFVVKSEILKMVSVQCSKKIITEYLE